MMEHLHMTLGFHIERFFHRTAIDEDWHIAIEDINLLVGIVHHGAGGPDAAERNHYASQQE